MTPADWKPDAHLLAAYFDGELDQRPDAAELKARLAAWVQTSPEARAEARARRRLANLWKQTTPSEPSASAWQRTLDQIEQHRLNVAVRPTVRPSRRRMLVGLISAACVLVAVGLAMYLVPHAPTLPRPEAGVEILAVAGPGDVTIVRIDGDDTDTLVVGELPVFGPLELAGPGEVQVTRVSPDADDQMMPSVRAQGSQRPMVYARIGEER